VLRHSIGQNPKTALPYEIVRVPCFWPAVAILVTPVLLGVGVFLRRYRGTDRTALALAVLVGIGLALLCGLAWFQAFWGGREVSRTQLRWAGFRIGGIAGLAAGPIALGLLGVRWAIDQLGGPVGEQFLPALMKALGALMLELLSGLPVFAVLSMLLGALAGWGVAEVIVACCPRHSPLLKPRE
jgi:hypothetical protein